MVKIERIYWLLFISIFLICLSLSGFDKSYLTPVTDATASLKNPVFKLSIVIKNFSQVLFYYPQIAQIAQENNSLTKSNQELNLELKRLAFENQKLREQLDAPLPSSFQYIPADVISLSRYMEVGKGEKDNVKKGMAVVDGSTFIGKIASVGYSRSRVILPSDPDIAIPVKTGRGAKGKITGQAGGVVMLNEVLQKEQLFIDDLVVTSGEGDYPPNLIIGKVQHINADDVSPYKKASIAVPLDYASAKIIFIISKI